MNILELILKRRKNIGGKSTDPIENFVDKWSNSLDLIKEINKKIESKTLVDEAKKNYIISIVTGLEVFLKDTFIKLINENPDLSTKRLEKKKVKNFTLEEVEIIRENNISKGEIIAGYIIFQNLKDVETAFSLLLNFKFFNEFKKYKWYYDKKDYMQIEKNFYLKIKEMIDLRHDFIHDINFKKTLTMRKISEIDKDVIVFVSLIDFFIFDLLNRNISWPKEQYSD